ncbi:MAG: DUF1538 domain-containing protein [Firmicutes bacterium]|nr:DUF1538 domain-containing protein [Bacillota bacterium]
MPITLIVLVLCFSVAPVPNGVLVAFILGAVLLTLGMGLFTLGVDVAMTPIGIYVGSGVTKSRKLPLIIGGSFLIGTVITVSEPDLQVLAEQVPGIPKFTLIIAVALGVGIFLILAMLRILLQIKLSRLLLICYAAVFALAAVTPESFLAVAFDSGGVTTGPMTVPFIMALGVGAAAIRSDKGAQDDSFGLVALGSVGPVLAVMLLGLIFGAAQGEYTPPPIPDYADSRQVWQNFVSGFPIYFKEVALALSPILLFFALYQIFSLKLPRRQIIKLGVGLGYTFFGLVLFLTGVNMGFMAAGHYLGGEIAGQSHPWLLIPISMILGYFIVAAEPAVHVLTKQVVEITDGAITAKAMKTSLSIGVALSLALSMIRLLSGLSLWWFLIPGYFLALAATFFCPQIFTSIAFDSGGVASGPMTATFVMPFAIGACTALGRDVITQAFGVVSMVAMTPLLTIQALGLYYQWKQQQMRKLEQASMIPEGEIIAYTQDIDIVEWR